MAALDRRPAYAVIGLGQFGAGLASGLIESGCSVLGIVGDAEAAQGARDGMLRVAVLDTTDEVALNVSRIATFEAVIVACEDDFERNLLTTVALKRVGVRHVIAVAHTERQREVLLRMGADRVLKPEQDAGRSLARELQASGVREEGRLGPAYRIATFAPPASLLEQRLEQSGLPELVTVLAIWRHSELLVFPTADTVLQEGDLLAVVGSEGQIKRLAEL